MDRHALFECRIGTGGGNPAAYDILKPNNGRQILVSATWYLRPGAASRKRETSSGLNTTGSLRGFRTKGKWITTSGLRMYLQKRLHGVRIHAERRRHQRRCARGPVRPWGGTGLSNTRRHCR